MRSVKLNHWYLDENELSISLMRFHISIEICHNGDNLFYRLRIIDENRKELIFNMYTLEDAIWFSEAVINKCMDIDEIIDNYRMNFEQNKFKSLIKK